MDNIGESHTRLTVAVPGGRGMEVDLAYYRRRSAQETLAASEATDGRVREIHLELARRYAERAQSIDVDDSERRPRLVAAD